MPLIPLIFWGSALLSIGISAVGVVRKSPWMLVVGAILAVPLAFYLGATPLFRIWSWFLPGLQLVSAMAVRRSAWVAAVLLLPFVSLAIWLAAVVIRQQVGAA